MEEQKCFQLGGDFLWMSAVTARWRQIKHWSVLRWILQRFHCSPAWMSFRGLKSHWHFRTRTMWSAAFICEKVSVCVCVCAHAFNSMSSTVWAAVAMVAHCVCVCVTYTGLRVWLGKSGNSNIPREGESSQFWILTFIQTLSSLSQKVCVCVWERGWQTLWCHRHASVLLPSGWLIGA